MGSGNTDAWPGAGRQQRALCDVDFERAGWAFKKYPPTPTQYKDFRKMLDEQKDIDAVIVATQPDHMHAIALDRSECGGQARVLPENR